ncbi:thrombospondin type 3 repeat-containing protein [Flavobacteriaceae bacterium]|nr:thrombospondin type 3 repeat-containing protein [Flavobacteriaceae bacterium]
MDDVTIHGNENVGGALGSATSSTLDEVHVYGNVTGNINTGGLVGRAYNESYLAWTSFQGNVKGNTVDESDYQKTGGLVGKLEYSSTITESWSSGTVDGNYMVGGLVGQNAYSSINNSYSRSNVTGAYNAVGGFIGWNQTDTSISGVQYNYSSGSVDLNSNLSDVGGFIGYQATCSSCSARGNDNYWYSSGSSHSGGSSLVSGIATNIEAKSKSTYTNWDFNESWMISGNLNDGYPFIRGNNELDLIDITFSTASNTLVVSFNQAMNLVEEEDDLVKEDFILNIYDPNPAIGNSTASLVSSTALSLDVSADEKTLTFTVSYTGTFDGEEELHLSPASNNSIEYNNEKSVEKELYLSVKFGHALIKPVLTSFTSNKNKGQVYVNDDVHLIANFSRSMAASPVITFSSNEGLVDSYPMQAYSYGKESRDASNSTSNSTAGNTDQWQSFTVSNTGRLTKVGWKMANPVINGEPQPINLKVYRGEGTSGELLAISENLFTPAYNDVEGNYIEGELIYFDLHTENIDVSTGETLTLRLSLSDVNIGVDFLDISDNNPYGGGRASNDTSWDYTFEAYVRPSSSETENWQYSYTIPNTNASVITASVSGTDTYGNAYSGTDSLTFTIRHELPNYLPTEGLIAWYPFNGNANDESGNGKDGNLFGTSSDNDKNGSSGKSLYFDAENDYITLDDNILTSPTSDYSFAAWIKPGDQSTITTSGGESRIFLQQNVSETGILMNRQNVLYVSAWLNSSNGKINASSSFDLTPFIDQWTFIYYSFDLSNQKITLQVNSTVTETIIPATNLSFFSYSGLPSIGRQESSQENYYKGNLDEMGFWNRVLSPAEVNQLFTGVIDTVSPTVVLSHSANSTTLLNGKSVTISATFSEAMQATPTINISGGQATDAAMSATASSALWVYTWTASSTIATEVSITVSGTDLAGNAYSGTDSLTFSFSVLPNYLPTNGLIAWYPFNGNANDESGNSLHGTNNGAVLTTDKYNFTNSAYLFDSGDFIDLGNNENLNPQTALTISSWINLSDFDTHHTIVGRNQSSGQDYGYNMGVLIDQNNELTTLRYGIGNSTDGSVVDKNHPESLSQNQWYHFVSTYESGLFKMYLNGELVFEAIDNSISLINQNNHNTYIGKYRQITSNQFFRGKIDDVGFWNRALSQAEVAQLYNGIIDTVSPTVTLTHNASPTTTVSNGDTVTVTATFSEAMQATPTINISSEQLTNATMSATASSALWVYTWTASSTLATEVSITVSGTDLAGNAYSGSDSLTFSIELGDQLAPQIFLSDNPTTQETTGGATITITAISDEILSAAPVLAFSDQSTVSMSTTNSSTQWVYDWIVPTEINGTISITAIGYDLAGNEGTSTSSLTYFVDNRSAEATLMTSQENGYLNANETLVVTATFDEDMANGVRLGIIADANTQLDFAMTATSSKVWEYAWTLPTDWPDGEFTLVIHSAFDLAGKAFTGAVSETITLDTTSPTIALKWNKENPFLRGGETILYTAVINEALSTPPLFSMSGIVSPTAMTATNSETHWNYSLSIPEGVNVTASVTVEAEDKAGNKSLYTSTSSFTIDSEIPVLISLELAEDNSTIDLVFNDNIYTSATSSSSFSPDDFILNLSGGTAGFDSPPVTSISVNENSIQLALALKDNVSGEELLTVSFKNERFFDKAGNAVQSQQSTNSIYLNDKTNPYIESIEVSENSLLKLIFNEVVYPSMNSSNTLTVEHFMLKTELSTTTLGSSVPVKIEQEGKIVSLYFTVQEKIQKGEELIVQLIKPIFDASGNSTSTLDKNNRIALIQDTDFDGVADELDACPNSPEGESVDENGCTFSQKDQDSDGILDELDACPNSPKGEEVDENGCAQIQLDKDLDGVLDEIDVCPNSPKEEEVDEKGCAYSQLDDDNDGFVNGIDSCLGSEEGEEVDEKGCTQLQRDPDQDGVENPIDQCPDTAEGQIVDEKGCALKDQDLDLDGVPNELDLCPNTPLNQNVNENGCAEIELDSDLDGVGNEKDLCPDTPIGVVVDENGCSQKENIENQGRDDDDKDGIINLNDLCPETPEGSAVDDNGCTMAEVVEATLTDNDLDGVENDKDLCPDTEEGAVVNEFGCPLSEIDADFDKINDDIDRCLYTPIGEKVDEYGCSISQKENDLDLDGIENAYDRCPDTPFGESVDEFGCTQAQADNDIDLDGVPNELDACPFTTPMDEVANTNGCSVGEEDDDGDGVLNALDRCNNTPTNEKVDSYGCSEDQLDSDDDGDGIKNKQDRCPNTPPGVAIDAFGCAFKAAKIYAEKFEQVENKRDDDVSNVNVFLGRIVVEDTNKSQDVFNNTVQIRILEGQDAALFRIDGRDLYLIGGLDYEENREHQFTVEATNDKGIVSTKTIKLIVIDIPNSSTRSSYNIVVFDVQNEQEDAKVSYKRYFNPNADNRGVGKWKIKKKIVGGNDAHLFSVRTRETDAEKNEDQGDYLDFITPPDHENPQDHNRDNIYEVDVVNINTEDGDSTQPIPVTQTNLVVPENSDRAIELQSVPAAPTDDTDGDGVNDIVDNSPFVFNPDQSDTDGDGVGDVTDDADHDGVWNPFDECNETPYNTIVDAKGCAIFWLPTNAFTISKAEKCIDENSIIIDFASSNYQYNVAVNGVQINSTPIDSDELEIPELSSGSYGVCITVEGKSADLFERCYTINIDTQNPLSVSAKKSNQNKTVEYSLKGGKVYTITQNGVSFQTTKSKVNLTLAEGYNEVKITTGIECQGIFEESYFNSSEVLFSPVPFNESLSIFVGGNDRNLVIDVYSSNGRLISSEEHSLNTSSRIIQMQTSHLLQGSYVIKLKGATTLISEIIIKE